MHAVALQLWPQLLAGKRPPEDRAAAIKAVLDEAARKHASNETVIAQASRDLAEATAFVREKGIVSVLDEPVEIAPTPEFQRGVAVASRSEEHTSELQSQSNLVCRLLLEKKKKKKTDK